MELVHYTQTINIPGSLKVCTSLCKHCTMSTLHYVCHALCLHCIMSTLHFLGKLDVHLQLKLHSNVRLAQNIDTLDLCNCGWSTLLSSIHCTPWASFTSTIYRQIAFLILVMDFTRHAVRIFQILWLLTFKIFTCPCHHVNKRKPKVTSPD